MRRGEIWFAETPGGNRPEDDGVPTVCVVNFDNLHTLPKETFRRRVSTLSAARIYQACRVLAAATGC